jgi:uncharacterized membrane protein YdjX (TVP38/TMEM64 family)
MQIKTLKRPLILVICVLLAIWASSSLPAIPEWVGRVLEPARDFYTQAPAAAIVLFCIAHLSASLFSIPGSCTGLNILSGAVFGFAAGCAIVYSITMVSALLAYRVGEKLGRTRVLERYSLAAQDRLKNLDRSDYWSLVALRLSPILPFGILNLMMGAVKVPWLMYLVTTFVGIFFDVVLLNGLGAR